MRLAEVLSEGGSSRVSVQTIALREENAAHLEVYLAAVSLESDSARRVRSSSSVSDRGNVIHSGFSLALARLGERGDPTCRLRRVRGEKR